MTPKICEAEVTVTPLVNKICKPWHLIKQTGITSDLCSDIHPGSIFWSKRT